MVEVKIDVTPLTEEKLDFDDDTLRAIAEVYKNEGNDAYKRRDFNNAAHFYTEGIKVGCSDDELNAKLYSNRATAHFYLENYHETILDAKIAVDLQPTYIKAIERGASACVKLCRYEDAIDWCDKGLAINKRSTILLDLRNRSVNKRNKLQKTKHEVEDDARNQTGKDSQSTEDAKKNIENYKISFKSAEVRKDKTAQLVLFCEIGTAYQMLGDFTKAIYYHQHHLQLAKVVGDRKGEGIAYGNLGNAYHNLGDFNRAIHYHELCMRIAKEVGSRKLEGRAYGNLGNGYQSLAHFRKAIHYHELQLQIAKEVDNRAREGDAYCNLGNDYAMLGDFERAASYNDLCLKIAKEVGNRVGEGSAYCNLGSNYYIAGDFKQAIHCHELCLKIARQVGNKPEEGRAHGNIGTDHHSLGDFKKAIYHHELHLEIAKHTANRAEEGTAYGNLGTVYHSLGDLKKAIHYHERHLQISREVGDKVGEGRAYGLLGIDCYNLGDFKKAIHYHKLDLEISKQVGNMDGEGAAYGNIGNCYLILGDFKEAIHYHELCIRIAKTTGNRTQEVTYYSNLGSAYHGIGDFKKAKHYHEQYLKVSKKLGTRDQEGVTYGNLGNDYLRLGDLEKAMHCHERQLEIAKEVQNRAEEGSAYSNLGNDCCKLGDFKQAIIYHEFHLEIAKKVGNRAQEGSAYCNLANAYKGLGDFKTSIHYYELHLEFTKEVGDIVGKGAAYYNLGCILELQGSLGQAVTHYQSAVRVLNDVRARLQLKDEWKISLRHLYRNYYTSLWRVLLNQGNVVEGLIAAEQGRSQALKDLMECKYGLQTIQDDSHTPNEAIFDIMSCLPSNTVFVAATKREVVLWFIQKGKLVDIRTKEISDNQSDEVITFFNSLMEVAFGEIGVRTGVKCEDRSLDKLRDGDQDDERPDRTQTTSLHLQSSALRTLYEATIGPIEDLIEGDELIIVPDGPLWLAPYAAFMDSNSKYLSESVRIRTIPSLTSVKLIADSSADYHHKSGALLVGDPWVQEVVVSKRGKKLHQLPCAREEVEMIGRILNTVPLTGKDATKAEVLKRLSSVALVHIAAHGRMETGEIALAPNPTTSSQTPTEEDFLLTMTDVLKVQIRAGLVVLSCCHSGRGEVKAEGVVGVARAFLGAGARSVLVSLWAIDDEATLEFMKCFYQHLVKGKTASESLNRSMKFMRETEKFNEVKYWAPFVLIGDDVTLEFSGNG